jgi:hypothetical protein
VTPTRIVDLVRVLADAGVEFIIVGGVAANLHGSATTTVDLDVVYRRTEENLARLVRALAPFEPYLRGAPPGLPFRFDVGTLRRGLNFMLSTSLGAVDLFGELIGGGTYEDLLQDSDASPILGHSTRYLSLERLIVTKRATGRPKDLMAIAELEALLEERGKR